MVATMNEEKKQAELLARRTELVDRKLKELNDKEVAEFQKILRTYRYVYDKLLWTKKYLLALDSKLEANQKSILMELITRERYKSHQDFLEKITLELKIDFYELELEKIGITYVQYQKEFQLIRDNLNNPNLSEEEESQQDLISNLYSVSLKIKVLQQMGISFV